MVLKARALLGLGQHDQASKIASLVLRQEPHNVEALFVRGKVGVYSFMIFNVSFQSKLGRTIAQALFRSGSLDHAATHFTQALRLDPDFSQAREALKVVRSVERAKKEGNEAFSRGDYSTAIECYTNALQADSAEEVQLSLLVSTIHTLNGLSSLPSTTTRLLQCALSYSVTVQPHWSEAANWKRPYKTATGR